MRQSESKLILNEEGSGLILALMTLMVLAVLGASLGAITIGSHRLGAVNRDDTSAYYIAEAGANQAYEEIENEIRHIYNNSSHSDASSFFRAVENNEIINKYMNEDTLMGFEAQNGKQPQSLVTLFSEKTEDKKIKTYTIYSQGTIENINREVIKEFDVRFIQPEESKPNLNIPENAALIAKNSIELKQSKGISGDIHTDATRPPGLKATNDFTLDGYSVFFNPKVEGNINRVTQGGGAQRFANKKIRDFEIPWNEYESIVKNFPDVNINDFDNLVPEYVNDYNNNPYNVHKNNSVILSEEFLNGYTLSLERDTRINRIVIPSSRVLNIQTNGKDITIYTEELHFKNSTAVLNILGEGKVTFIVTNNFAVDSDSRLNVTGNTNQLNIHYTGPNNIVFEGEQRINANLFFYNSNLLNIGGSSELNGQISMSKNDSTIKFYGSNNAHKLAVIAPFSSIEIEGSANIEGVLISNSFLQKNSASKVSHSNEHIKTVLSSEETSEVISLEDLITSGPVIEPK